MKEEIVAVVVVTTDGGVPGEHFVDRAEFFTDYRAAVYRAEEIERTPGWRCEILARSTEDNTFVAVER